MGKKKLSLRYKNAFTMIELVVVIIVLSVIGYITFQATSGFYKKVSVTNGVIKELQIIYQATQEFKTLASIDGTFSGIEGNLSAFLPSDYKVNVKDPSLWIEDFDINSSVVNGLIYRVRKRSDVEPFLCDIYINYPDNPLKDKQIAKLISSAAAGFLQKLGKGEIVDEMDKWGTISLIKFE